MSDTDLRLKAFTHEGRRAMLRSTMTAERSASELSAIAGLSRPAASQHLAVLVQSGLMTVRADGRRRWYRADRGNLDQLRSDLDVFWSDKLDALKRAAES